LAGFSGRATLRDRAREGARTLSSKQSVLELKSNVSFHTVLPERSTTTTVLESTMALTVLVLT
jgi:hypothetical protein